MEIPILSFDQEYITIKKIHKLYTANILDYKKTYKVLGTVDSVRRSGKKIMFIVLRSKNSIRTLQCTYEKTKWKRMIYGMI